MHKPKANLSRLVGRTQRGAVLIVSLVILLVLTIISVAGVQNSTMEERMAGNYRDRFAAFQAAEAALRFGENDVAVATIFGVLPFDGTLGTFDVTEIVGAGSADWADPTNYARTVNASTLSGIASPPVYYLEKLPKIPLPKSSLVVGFQSKPKDIQYYRVTGKGFGSSGKAEVVLQSVYHR